MCRFIRLYHACRVAPKRTSRASRLGPLGDEYLLTDYEAASHSRFLCHFLRGRHLEGGLEDCVCKNLSLWAARGGFAAASSPQKRVRGGFAAPEPHHRRSPRFSCSLRRS